VLALLQALTKAVYVLLDTTALKELQIHFLALQAHMATQLAYQHVYLALKDTIVWKAVLLILIHPVLLVTTALKAHNTLLNILVNLEHTAMRLVLELHQNAWNVLGGGIVKAMDKLNQLHYVLLDISVLLLPKLAHPTQQ